ncbi:MAG: hypothetical protein A2784_00255 [Candidatus Chisholmbacteria bacterium RIFCSPHIGHO2_01_FULL_48_12]|uniref:Orotate phosphoribosyltransferase n=1 Tax=Candidatus Chisholmbacteria bacterium RIFCSPHIGHO2_01_FULL_48_12 TaxID=1797589 RepID=A0A1G1VP15_9BACT|nr:MAG: hypothetical protein A2784_00255 [Candidatus Chisholmbacteria bacterium RIFCSPHIGHO2_01_FULL_48_12]
MTSTNIVTILKQVGAVITDSHFVYTSGKHGSVYINKDTLYPHTRLASRVGSMIAQKFKTRTIDVVAGPALGGIILSQWTAFHLSHLKRKNILGVYTEKDDQGNQIFRRGYDQLIHGKKVLIVEDLTTTGGSVAQVVASVKQAGGQVTGVCVMVNRDPQNVTSRVVGAPFTALGAIKADAFDATDCPLCRNHIPINTQVGHGRDFLARKSLQSGK